MKCIEFTAVKSEVRMTCIHMDITGIDLFDQIVSMACTKVRLMCSWILLVLIFLNLNAGMVCARVRLRSTWLSLVLQLS